MTEKVKKQILAIRETGLTNMFDLNAVQRIAYDSDPRGSVHCAFHKAA